jgi:hypothetical protein
MSDTHDLTPEWRERLDKTIASFVKDPLEPGTIYYTNFLNDDPQKESVTRRFNWFGRADPQPEPKYISRMVSSAEIDLGGMSVDELIDALEQSKPALTYSFSHLRANDGEVSVTYMHEEPESEDSFQERLARWHLNRAFQAEWNRVELQRKKEEALDRANQLEKKPVSFARNSLRGT